MEKLPLIMIGLFVLDQDDRLYLRTKSGAESGYRCLNEQMFSGDDIQNLINDGLLKKLNLKIDKMELLSVSDGLNIPKEDKFYHMVFIDYVVRVRTKEGVIFEKDRNHRWDSLDAWLHEDESVFAPHIKNIVSLLSKKLQD